MFSKPIRLLARRPLCYPGFTRKLLVDLDIASRFLPHDILYLTPQKRRARSAQFEILSLYPDEALRPPVCLTLVTLAERLVSDRADKGIIDERDRRFILLKLIHEAKGLVFREEHLGLLSSLYSDLKRHYPRDWERIPDMSRELIFDTDTSSRLKQAVAILTVYDEYLQSQQLIDHESLMGEAVALVGDLNHKLLIVEGYFEPPAAEQELFDSLLRKIPEVLVILPDDKLAAKGERFFNKYNFNTHPTPEAKKQSPSLWCTYPSREDEVKAISRQICRLCEDKTDPHEIVVVFPRLEIYRPIVERVFSRYGLSPEISVRPRLESLPAIQIVLDLVRTAQNDYRRRDVVGIVLSQFFTKIPEEVRHWIDLLTREEGLISGPGSWTDWFLRKIPYSLSDHPDKERIVGVIRSFLKDIISKLKLIIKSSTIASFVGKLQKLLEYLGWDVPDDIRTAFGEILARFCRMGELADQRHVGTRFILDTLEILLKKELPESIRDREIRRIRVMPLVESRWLESSYVFLGGLVDGEFPSQLKRDYLLPEKLREKLGFLSIEDKFCNDEFEFRRLLTMPKMKLFLSAPIMESDRPLLTSVFLADRELDQVKTEEVVYCEEEHQLLLPKYRKEATPGVEFEDTVSLNLLNSRYSSAYPFHVTSLELYRNCPYRFYLRNVLGVEPYEEPTAEPEARLLGTVVHDVLYQTLRKYPDTKGLGNKLIENLTRYLDTRRLNPFVRMWIEQWIKSRLDWFIDQEDAFREQGWIVDPKWLERRLEFEFDEGFSIRGRVDRVDWMGQRARVLDYKTGNESYFRLKIKKGTSIQLPLYCEMIRRLRRAEIDAFGVYSFLDSKIEQFSSPNQEIAAALSYTKQAVDCVRSGSFPSNDNPLCRFCEYAEFCEAS